MKEGYRIGRSKEKIAWKAMDFEHAIGNDYAEQDIHADLSDFLGVTGPWSTVLSAFRERYGDVEGEWLTTLRDEAINFYAYHGGPLLVYEYDLKMMIIYLGATGIYVINPKFIREETFEPIED